MIATSGLLSSLCVGDAGDEVRRAGPQRREADARVAGQPAVNVGHERRSLFVSGRSEGDRRVPEREQQFLDFFARETEDVLDTLDLEAVDE